MDGLAEIRRAAGEDARGIEHLAGLRVGGQGVSWMGLLGRNVPTGAMAETRGNRWRPCGVPEVPGAGHRLLQRW